MSTFLTQNMPADLVRELKALAKLPRAPSGYLPALAVEYGYAVSTLRNAVSDLRADRRDKQDGAARVDPAGVCGPERASAISGHGSGGVAPLAAGASRDLDVSSLNLGARGESRAVAPAAGASPRVGEAPAAEFSEDAPYSPGLCWARAALRRGVAVDKLLRTAGDRLTWRDRDVLRRQAQVAA